MYEILKKKELVPGIILMVVKAPRVAKNEAVRVCKIRVCCPCFYRRFVHKRNKIFTTN